MIDNRVRLSQGTTVNFTVSSQNVYKSSQGHTALLANGDQNLAVRHTGLYMYYNVFVANNLDWAWQFIKNDDGTYQIYNDYGGGYYVGYDSSRDHILIVRPSDTRIVKNWRVNMVMSPPSIRAPVPWVSPVASLASRVSPTTGNVAPGFRSPSTSAPGPKMYSYPPKPVRTLIQTILPSQSWYGQGRYVVSADNATVHKVFDEGPYSFYESTYTFKNNEWQGPSSIFNGVGEFKGPSIKISLPVSIPIKVIYVRPEDMDSAPQNVSLLGSNDDKTWKAVMSQSRIEWRPHPANNKRMTFMSINANYSNEAFQHYALVWTETSNKESTHTAKVTDFKLFSDKAEGRNWTPPPPPPSVLPALPFTISHPDGRTWKMIDNRVRLSQGTTVNFTVSSQNVYKSSQGHTALLANGDQNLAVRHTGLYMYYNVFVANNLDWAWQFIKNDDGTYQIYNDYGGGYYVGYDSSRDHILIVRPSDTRIVKNWRVNMVTSSPSPLAFSPSPAAATTSTAFNAPSPAMRPVVTTTPIVFAPSPATRGAPVGMASPTFTTSQVTNVSPVTTTTAFSPSPAMRSSPVVATTTPIVFAPSPTMR